LDIIAIFVSPLHVTNKKLFEYFISTNMMNILFHLNTLAVRRCKNLLIK